MNRKHNPWLSMAALVLLAVIVVMICAGCGYAEKNEALDRFTTEYAGQPQGMRSSFYIITDTETGVQYLATGSGVVKLEEANT